MRFCEHDGCNQPVFGTCKKTGIGYCKSHQTKRADYNFKSITQRAIEKHKLNPTKTPKKHPRFQRTIQTPTEKEIMEINGVSDINGGIWNWFLERRKEMTGICQNCGGKTEKNNDKTFHFSIAHLLEKSRFKSISNNENNWLELCYYGNSCHANFDNKMIDLIDMNCFDTIIQKFVKIYPFIAQEEKRRIPPILIEYLKTEL